MKEFIKNDKVLALLRKAMESKVITFEEINEQLETDFPPERIEFLINGMVEQGIEIVQKSELEKKESEKGRARKKIIVPLAKTDRDDSDLADDSD
ncbi:MAG: RNA polymerase sigma factor region1.1 domain-containing protein, partial [Cetobacterium sp.]